MLGLALDAPEERHTAERAARTTVSYVDGFVPDDPARDLAALGVAEVLRTTGAPGGVALRVAKGWPPGSGMGSSAASAVGAVVATNALLGEPLDAVALLACAGRAEQRGTGSTALDNVAASLMGGLVCITGQDPPAAVSLPAPPWPLAVVLPQVVVRTEAARAVLTQQVALQDALSNLRDLAGLLAAIQHSDLQAFAHHLRDHLAAPARRPLWPFLDAAKEAAVAAGAPTLSISGSGPALFAPCADRATADRVVSATVEAIGGRGWVSTVAAAGARVV